MVLAIVEPEVNPDRVCERAAWLARVTDCSLKLLLLRSYVMRRTKALTVLAAASVLAASCYSDPMSEKGFRLPDGDAEAGRDAFVYMQCNECHTVNGIELPSVPLAEPPYVDLGGEVSRVRTYGELVTAITNPSHKLADGYAEDVVSTDGESNMYNYNRYMTVQELTDLVTFLQPHYEVVVPKVTYPVYR